jgi:hypothetical protein
MSGKRTLIRNSTAEFLIFTGQAGEQSNLLSSQPQIATPMFRMSPPNHAPISDISLRIRGTESRR